MLINFRSLIWILFLYHCGICDDCFVLERIILVQLLNWCNWTNAVEKGRLQVELGIRNYHICSATCLSMLKFWINWFRMEIWYASYDDSKVLGGSYLQWFLSSSYIVILGCNIQNWCCHYTQLSNFAHVDLHLTITVFNLITKQLCCANRNS